MHFDWTMSWPATSALGILVVAAGLWIRRHYHQTRPEATPRMRRLLTGLRIASVVFLAAAAAGPNLVRESRSERAARIAVIVEDSGSMAVADLPSGLSRWSRAAAIVAGVDSLRSGLDGDPRLESWRGSGTGPPAPYDSALPPTAVGTGLEALLRQVARSSADDPNITILISDGHETALSSTALETTPSLVVVGLGDPLGPPDVWLHDLRAPDAAFVGDEVVVEATVGLRGRSAGEDAPVTVVLAVGDTEVDRQVIVPQGADERLRCELRTTFESEGLELLTVRLDAGDQEVHRENNEGTAAIRIHAARRRVLCLTSRPSWLVRFLAQAAEAENRIDLVVVAPTANGPARSDSLSAWTAPTQAEQWLQWQGVILADDRAARAWLDASVLAEAVTQGLGLMLVEDPSSVAWPAALSALSPVGTSGRVSGAAAGIALSPGAGAHAILDGVGRTAADLDRLPPVTRWHEARARDGALVLLEARIDGGASSGPDGEHPLLVASSLGDERVVWLGAPDLWTQIFWRPPSALDERRKPLARLARNLMVWLAQGDENAGATLLGQRTLYAEGEPVRIRARRRGLRGEALSPPRALSVTPLDTVAVLEPMRLSLSPDRDDATLGAATLPMLPPGRYRLQAHTESGRALGESRDIIVESRSPERFQTTQDRDRLQALCVARGGIYLDGSSAALMDSLGGRLAADSYTPTVRVRTSSLDPTSSWVFLALMVGCLGLEWFLRRRQGML